MSGTPGDPDAFGTCTIDASFEVNSILYKVDVYKIDEPTNIYILGGDLNTPTDSIDTDVCPVATLMVGPNARKYKLLSPKYGEYHIQGTFPLNATSLLPIVQVPAFFYCQVVTRQFSSGEWFPLS